MFGEAAAFFEVSMTAGDSFNIHARSVSLRGVRR
jgi:hypothetical protein